MVAIIRPRAELRAGQRLHEIRMQRGLSQGTLAQTLDVSVATIQHYEHGRLHMNAERIEQLAHILQCDIGDLLAKPGSAIPKGRRVIEAQARFDVEPLWPISIGYYSRDANDRLGLVDADRVALTICGLADNAPGFLAWHAWFTRLHADDRPQVASELVRLERRGVFGMRYRLVGHDGVERSIIDCARTSLDENGKPIRLMGKLIDVTNAPRTASVERRMARIIEAVVKDEA